MTATTNRLDWTITRKARWIATHNVTGETLVAPSKAALMSKINQYDAD